MREKEREIEEYIKRVHEYVGTKLCTLQRGVSSLSSGSFSSPRKSSLQPCSPQSITLLLNNCI